MRWGWKGICRRWRNLLAGSCQAVHLISPGEVNQNEKKLTQAVVQITQLLGMYHAETARILRINCSDVAELFEAKSCLKKNTLHWLQAEKLVEFYYRLYKQCDGDETCMVHWLRKQNKKINAIPLYAMVDELRIDDVLNRAFDADGSV